MKNVYIFIAIEAKTPDKELKAKLIKEHFIESPFKIYFTFHKLQPGEIAGYTDNNHYNDNNNNNNNKVHVPIETLQHAKQQNIYYETIFSIKKTTLSQYSLLLILILISIQAS